MTPSQARRYHDAEPRAHVELFARPYKLLGDAGPLLIGVESDTPRLTREYLHAEAARRAAADHEHLLDEA
jgi:hypothetical protein